MKSILMAASLAVAASMLLLSPVRGEVVYEVWLSGAPYSNEGGSAGDIRVAGFIEVTGFGPVGVAEIIDYRLTLSITNGGNNVDEDFASTWTPENSQFSFDSDFSNTSALVATETQLYIPTMSDGSGLRTSMRLGFQGAGDGFELDDCDFSTLANDRCIFEIFGSADSLDYPVAFLEFGFKDIAGDTIIGAAREGYNVFGDLGEAAEVIVIGTIPVPLFADRFEELAP